MIEGYRGSLALAELHLERVVPVVDDDLDELAHRQQRILPVVIAGVVPALVTVMDLEVPARVREIIGGPSLPLVAHRAAVLVDGVRAAESVAVGMGAERPRDVAG